MLIIGCDFHTRYQQIAMAREGTAELLLERRLDHESGEAHAFYRSLQSSHEPVRVGIEATGPIHWFERLLAELGHELWIGDSARIRTSEVRKQKTDVRDARLILDLLLARRLPKIWVRPLKEYEAAGGRAQWLEVLEDVGDFLAGFFGVVDGDVFALFGADHGIAANGLAGVHGGMLRNFEGFLCAIRSLHGDGLRAFADIFHGALGGVHRFITDPLDGMVGLLFAFASGVDDGKATFLAGGGCVRGGRLP